jgi:hypothetical protein
MTVKQSTAISEKLSTIDIEIVADEIKELETVDEVEEYLQENGYFDVEIIYYTKAMDYLHEHDNSLQISLGLAHDMGYTLDKVNSELLASLLASENLREEFGEIRDEIEEILA